MNNAGAADLGAPRPEPTPEENQQLSFRTAFIVFQEKDGHWAAHPNPNLLAENIDIQYVATADEIAGACAVIQGDVTAQKAAGMVQSLMMAAAKQAQEAAVKAREAQVNQEIARKAGLK